VGTLCAAGEEHVEAELGDVMKLALRRRVVDRRDRIFDETEERVAVILVPPPPDDGTNVALSMLTQAVPPPGCPLRRTCATARGDMGGMRASFDAG